jgi:hypothetical protein
MRRQFRLTEYLGLLVRISACQFRPCVALAATPRERAATPERSAGCAAPTISLEELKTELGA